MNLGVSTLRKSKGDVAWYLPGKKKPFAFSTQAVSDYIVMLTSETGGSVYDLLNQSQFIKDPDACQILQHYADNGYGDTPANKLFGVGGWRLIGRDIDGHGYYTDGRHIFKMEYA